MKEATITLLDDAELDSHEKRAEELAARLNEAVNNANETIRSIRADWRGCCDSVAAGNSEEVQKKQADFEKVVMIRLPRLRLLAAQVDRAIHLLPHEIEKANEFTCLLEWLERFHDKVLRVWTGSDALEELVGEHYPLSSDELDAIGARHPAPAAWYEEDSKPFLSRDMVMSRRGRIVWVEISDPQGRNSKCRPAVIVTANEDFLRSGKRPRLPTGAQHATGPVAATSRSSVAASGLACPLEPSSQPGRLRLRVA